MAAVADLEVIKVNGATDGTDTYPGIRGVSVRKNPLNFYRYRAEGALQPTVLTQISSDEPPVRGQLRGKGMTFISLANTNKDSFTVDGVDASDGTSVTLTLTNARFSSFAGDAGENAPGQATIEFEATNAAWA